jgi:hypothetical protein
MLIESVMKTLILLGALFLAGCTLPVRYGSPEYYGQLYERYVALCEANDQGTADLPCYRRAFELVGLAGIAVEAAAYDEERRDQRIVDALNEQNFWLMHQNSVNASRPSNLVDPLPQRGSSMGFMCRDAINRRDSGGAFIFC